MTETFLSIFTTPVSAQRVFSTAGLTVNRPSLLPSPSHAQRCPCPPSSATDMTVLCVTVYNVSKHKVKEASTGQKLTAFLFLCQQKKNASLCIYSQHCLNMNTTVKLVSSWILDNSLTLTAESDIQYKTNFTTVQCYTAVRSTAGLTA